MDKLNEMPWGQSARERIQEVRSDKTLEVSYMTYAQKMLDERRFAYAEGEAAGHAKGQTKGRIQGVRESILNFERCACIRSNC